MHARFGSCALLAALSLSAVARAEQPAPPVDAAASASGTHGPSHQDLAVQGGPGWSSDRTLGSSLAGTLMAEYRWRYLAAGPSFTAMQSVDHDGTSAYSGGLSVSAAWQMNTGWRAALTGILGFDRYEGVTAAGADCDSQGSRSSFCSGGARETLPYAELRLRAAYVFPVQDRTHLALGAGVYVGRDLAEARASYDRLDGTKGSLTLGATRVGAFASAGLTFDVAPVDRGAKASAGSGAKGAQGPGRRIAVAAQSPGASSSLHMTKPPSTSTQRAVK